MDYRVGCWIVQSSLYRDQNTHYSCLVHIFDFYSLVYIPCLEHGVNIWNIFGGIKAAVVLLLAAKGVKVVYNVPAVRAM